MGPCQPACTPSWPLPSWAPAGQPAGAGDARQPSAGPLAPPARPQLVSVRLRQAARPAQPESGRAGTAAGLWQVPGGPGVPARLVWPSVSGDNWTLSRPAGHILCPPLPGSSQLRMLNGQGPGWTMLKVLIQIFKVQWFSLFSYLIRLHPGIFEHQTQNLVKLKNHYTKKGRERKVLKIQGLVKNIQKIKSGFILKFIFSKTYRQLS